MTGLTDAQTGTPESTHSADLRARFAASGVASREFTTWERANLSPDGERLPHPSPLEPGGLPDGWMVVHEFGPLRGGTHWYICKGGSETWTLLWHDPQMRCTHDHISTSSAGRLLEAMEDRRMDRRVKDRLLDGIRDTLVGLFDTNDPREASEQALFALGGPLTYEPRAGR